MTLQLVLEAVSIVHRGHFNPAIFQPSWFAAQNLIRPQEAEAAEIEIIHPKAAVFTADWLRVNVLEDRFHAATIQADYFEPLRDLVLGVLGILAHTPLKALGINREFHYRYPSEDTWHEVGDRLAPKGDWESILKNPGMLSLTVQGKRPDGFEGYIQVKVEPSRKAHPGVFIEVNDHFQLASGDEIPPGTSKAIKIISSQWISSMSRALQVAESISLLGRPK